MIGRLLALALLCGAGPLSAEPRTWIEANKAPLLREYMELLAIPNVATDNEDIRRNADHIVKMMERRGLSPRLLESEDGKAPPLVYGEWRVPGAKRTYVLYAHYDGQPVTPADWTVTKPFTPLLMSEHSGKGGKPLPLPAASSEIRPEWRIYARGASDDKGGVMAILAAVDALKAEKRRPAFNLKIVLEGEEEQGSPNLAGLLRRHKEVLASDGWVIIDGPAHPSGLPQINLGVRGDVNMEITTYGPVRPLHSGHYGNWAPNPAMMLAELLATMKDETGRVSVKGFYDDVTPLSGADRAALAALPTPDDDLKRELAIGRADGGGKPLAELILQPSLNINGIRSADVGQSARNIIPATATATLDLRLVLGNDPERQVDKVAQHIRDQGYQLFEREPTVEERRQYPKVARIMRRQGYRAERISADHPLTRSVEQALRRHGRALVIPSMGGSLPLYLLRQELGAPNLVVSLWNHDNNQHAEDENIRLGNLFDGASAVAAIMTMK